MIRVSPTCLRENHLQMEIWSWFCCNCGYKFRSVESLTEDEAQSHFDLLELDCEPFGRVDLF